MPRQPLLRHAQIVRLGRLLDMLYKPAELADEIDVNPDTIYRSYLPAGLPHVRDAGDNIWIHGLAFAAWARDILSRRKAERQGMPDGYGWCMVCRRAVPMQRPKVIPSNHYLEILQAPCPNCKRTVNRARARQRGQA